MRTFLYLVLGLFAIWLAASHPGILGGPATPGSSYTVDNPWATSPGGDCHATIVAQDGTPPPGIPTLSPSQACGALSDAERQAACLGDWQPPAGMTARHECLEVQHRGCGTPGMDCLRLPDDATYYYHH